MTGDPKALVERFYAEVWNRADEQAAREILHQRLRFRGSLGPTRSGPDAFIAYLRQVHSALGRYRCTIEDLIAAGDRAAARLTFAGLHRGVFFGVPATGREISWGGSAFFTVADGRLVDIWVLGDIDAVKRQLGIVGAASFSPD
jgi:predicted ester cyclase